MSRSRKALFLGFCPGVGDDPPMIVFLVESLRALVDLRENLAFKHELIVCISQFQDLTSGDLHDNFPATRERSAARIGIAEHTYTNAVESSIACGVS